MSGYLKSFSEIPTYDDPGSQGQTCRDVLPEGVVPGLTAGYNRTQGPGHNSLHKHTDSHQVFVLVDGSCTLLRGQERIPIEAPCVVHIPPNTDHNVYVEEGQQVEYVYINRKMTEND